MNSKLSQITASTLCALLIGAGCEEPYTKDAPDSVQPAVVDILMRDSVFQIDPDGTELIDPYEVDSFTYTWDGTSAVFPSNFPYVRFSRLLDGSTIETTETDELTGRELGQCGPVAGAIEMREEGQPVEFIRTCYSPSDKLIGIQPADEDGNPVLFLKYETDYEIELTSNIQDKLGRPLEAETLAFRTRPFEILTVSDISLSEMVYGAPETAFATVVEANGSAGILSTVHANELRILFSGPVQGAAAQLALRDAQLLDDNDQPVSALDAEGQSVFSVFTSFSTNAQGQESPLFVDPRLVVVLTPQYQLSETGADGLPPGNYKLRFPATISDDGSVTGMPVTLGQQVEIPFEVYEPAE